MKQYVDNKTQEYTLRHKLVSFFLFLFLSLPPLSLYRFIYLSLCRG